MLYGGAGSGGADIYKTAVIDTIVAEVQSTPGEDRCVLLLGYKHQMEEMFQVRPDECLLIISMLTSLLECESGIITALRY